MSKGGTSPFRTENPRHEPDTLISIFVKIYVLKLEVLNVLPGTKFLRLGSAALEPLQEPNLAAFSSYDQDEV